MSNETKRKHSIQVRLNDEEYEAFNRKFKASGTGRSSVLAQHFIVSFKPGEILPERALQIGQEICEQFLKGEYQYFMACQDNLFSSAHD